MKRAWILSALGAVAILVGLAAPAAQADPAPVTSEATVKNSPDDGNPPWARDTFTRTTTITQTEPGVYKVKIADKGTFTAVEGAETPGDGTKNIERKDTGDLAGSGEFTVTNAKLAAHNRLNALDGRVYNNKKFATKQDVPAKRATGSWWKPFFKPGAESIGIENWTWTYKTKCESMTQTPEGVTGNITGKECPAFTPSVLKAANKCRVSKKDKRNWWTITNAAGGRTRTYWLHVTYGGHTTYEGQHTVAAGDTAPVRTTHGGLLRVGYYDGAGHHELAYAKSDASKLCG